MKHELFGCAVVLESVQHRANEQLVLALPRDEVQDNAPEFTVLVTNASDDIAAMGQLYRDRCDCAGGFTTRDMHRNQVTAHTVNPLGNAAGLHLPAQHRPDQPANPATAARSARVAAVFR